jgi:hypothetical protein
MYYGIGSGELFFFVFKPDQIPIDITQNVCHKVEEDKYVSYLVLLEMP